VTPAPLANAPSLEGSHRRIFQFDIWVLSMSDRTLRPLIHTADNEMTPEFSPDGRWLAYVSNESGRHEVYVQPYPGPG
jgi:Tol biopolymer transport system component